MNGIERGGVKRKTRYHYLGKYTLPNSMSIMLIEYENGSKSVEVHSDTHINKVTALGGSWSDEFSDKEILTDKDLIKTISNRFNLTLPEVKWQIR